MFTGSFASAIDVKLLDSRQDRQTESQDTACTIL